MSDLSGSRRFGRSLLACSLLTAVGLACRPGSDDPAWRTAFGYQKEALQRIDIRDYNYPFVPVRVGGRTIWLPFDTGNMSGLTFETELFKELHLPCTERANRYDSGGELISSVCVASGVGAELFGESYDSLRVYEFSHERLPGLVGPGSLPGTRFTLDYDHELMALDQGTSPAQISGFEVLQLVRSRQHPRLILVRGRLRGREVLIEIDTGKSRTTVDRALVEDLGLEEHDRGVDLGSVSMGSRSFRIASARIVSTAGISAGLPIPISIGIGSDVLSEFVFTVDYEAGEFWLESEEER